MWTARKIMQRCQTELKEVLHKGRGYNQNWGVAKMGDEDERPGPDG